MTCTLFTEYSVFLVKKLKKVMHKEEVETEKEIIEKEISFWRTVDKLMMYIFWKIFQNFVIHKFHLEKFSD